MIQGYCFKQMVLEQMVVVVALKFNWQKAWQQLWDWLVQSMHRLWVEAQKIKHIGEN
jgi:hypothetical protein